MEQTLFELNRAIARDGGGGGGGARLNHASGLIVVPGP
jgi:hypothetical protein